MTEAERITELESRLADAEARIARLEAAASPQYAPGPYPRLPGAQPWRLENPVPPRGCVCPPGAEFGCRSTDCPRRSLGGVPVTCGGGS